MRPIGAVVDRGLAHDPIPLHQVENHSPRGNLPSPKINNPQGHQLFTFVYAARADAEAGRDPVDKALAKAV
jgi:hypothetical protein